MNNMSMQRAIRRFASRAFLATAITVVTLVALPTESAAAAAKAAAQKAFPTPDALSQALADAAKANDSKALVALLGRSGDALVNSGDAVMDKRRAEGFAASYATKHAVKTDGDKATLTVGNDDWPMPIPAVKGAAGWTLDAVAGTREVVARRIGENELDAIQVVRAIVDAQHDYSSEDRDKDGLRDYASKFASTKGKHDGLYWSTKDGEPPSPLGPLVVRAAAEGYKGKGSAGAPSPYRGYYYRILTAQGKDAPGGARNYLAHGKLLGGFAVVAYPATYGNSGIMTFMANQDGTVYEKDLGATTAAAAKALKDYNPDKSWTAMK
jgi:Protein of unknown function (DUF2950)